MGIVKISPGNSKLGAIPSVSLPAIKTCRVCGCAEKCYAAKLERIRPSVREAYQHNLDVLKSDPDTYWREVEGAIMLSRFSDSTCPGTSRTRIIWSAWWMWPPETNTVRSCVSQSGTTW